MPMKVVQVSAEQTLPLRNEILRPGKPVSTCLFDGDEQALTRHFGALDDQGQIVGIVSIFSNPHPDLPATFTYQLRGMATSEQCRGLGVGILLIKSVEQYLTAIECVGLWANARTEALGFYKKQGYQVMSDEFMIENVGPHYLVAKALVS